MKIAFVSQPLDEVFPPNQNSIAIWIDVAANQLMKTNDIVIYSRGGRSQQRTLKKGKVTYRFLYSIPNRLVFKLNKSLSKYRDSRRPFFASILCFLDYSFQVALDLRAQQCDVVVLFNFSQFVPVIRLFNPNTKIVLRMGCEWLTQFDPKMIEGRISKVDLVISCSDFISNLIREAFPQHSSRCKTLHNGRDVDLFTPDESQDVDQSNSPKKLLFVGRVSPEKGVHILLEAFHALLTEHPELKLDIVGGVVQLEKGFLVDLSKSDRVIALDKYYKGTSNTSYFHYLQNLVRSLGLDGKVRFIGQVAHRELLRHYREATIVVFPSIVAEACGNPPIEAMSVGIPVISTDAGGPVEYVKDGETGLLTKPGDIDELASAIRQLLGNDELRDLMGKAGRKRAVEFFSIQTTIATFVDYYSQL